LYRNEENDGSSVRLHLVGRRHDLGAGYSNRDGIGAKVTAYEQGYLGDGARRIGFREIESHGGFSSESAIDAHFGLGSAAAADIRIVWPGSDGTRIVQDLLGVSAGASVQVLEAGTFTAVGAAEGPAGPRIRFEVMPNPVRDSARFTFGSSGEPPTGIDLFDLRGRLVRSIRLERAGAPGSWAGEWDRRARSGEEVPSGVYFARPSGGSPVPPQRVVVLR
ncbi:MAG: hypothetical protein EHM19_05835, partial [Candidatus Latescibacterota bacterium]